MILEAGGHLARYDYAKSRPELNKQEFGHLCMVSKYIFYLHIGKR